MRQLLLAGIILLSLPVAGQDKPNSYISTETKDHKHIVSTRFGFKAGYNDTNVSGVETNGAKTGYVGGELYAGFFGDTRLGKTIGLGYELLYSWTNDYNFIEFPLHSKLYFNRRLNILAGPRLDFVVDSENQYKNFGLAAEAGMQYKISNRFFGEARYALGLTKYIQDPGLDINKAKRSTLRFGLGVWF